MILKCLLLLIFGLLSVVSPPVFVGSITLFIVFSTIFSVETALEKIGNSLAKHRFAKMEKPPCNLLVLGILCSGFLALTGLAWGFEAQVSNNILEVLRSCTTIAMYFCSLLLMVGMMYKFVKLVD